MPEARKYPIDFRKDETEYIMQRWMFSQSCSLIGIGSVGKSNLLRHLSDPLVHNHYLGEEKARLFRTVIIDPNMLGPLPQASLQLTDAKQIRCWAGYELMMHRLFMALYPFELLSSDEARRFYESYQSLQDGTNPLYAYMGLRYFELGISYFLRQGVQIVFMFDEFEQMLSQMPTTFFQNLRGLRDVYKNQISYLAFTRTTLPLAAQATNHEDLEIEPFVELFTDNTYFVGPYNERDAIQMADELVRRSGTNTPYYFVENVLSATGRYAGLLRASLSVIDTVMNNPKAKNSDDLATLLAAKIPVRTECHTIWKSLTEDERIVLKAVARLRPYETTAMTELAITMLIQKRLLNLDAQAQSLTIEPPVVRAYILNYADEI
jgi:hypothetical protein